MDTKRLLKLRETYTTLSETQYRNWPDMSELDDCEQELADFIDGYVTAMLWSTGGETAPDGTELESLEGYELSPECRAQCDADCWLFIENNEELLNEYAEVYEPKCDYSVWECAGHDFWLTRAGHGVGFWDRGLDDLGDKLTESCKIMGEAYPYIGDDGKVYI